MPEGFPKQLTPEQQAEVARLIQREKEHREAGEFSQHQEEEAKLRQLTREPRSEDLPAKRLPEIPGLANPEASPENGQVTLSREDLEKALENSMDNISKNSPDQDIKNIEQLMGE